MSDRLTRHLGEFALVPQWLSAVATGNAVRLWCILWVYSGNGTHTAWPSQETLSAELGLSVSTIKRALQELQDLEVLQYETRLGTSNLYTLKWRIGTDQQVTSELQTQVTSDLPPRSPVSYEERLSEIDNQNAPEQVTSEPQPKLSKDEIRALIHQGRTQDQ